MNGKDSTNTDDYVSVSSELDSRGDAELRNPGDPEVDDEETLDNDLLNGTDSQFGIDDDIDTLSIIESDLDSEEGSDGSGWDTEGLDSLPDIEGGEFPDEQG